MNGSSTAGYLRQWAKDNGYDSKKYSDQEIIAMKQKKFELEKQAKYDEFVDEYFMMVCKDKGLFKTKNGR